MKPVYTGQRSVPSTDRKFRPQDEHLIEENKEELDEIHHNDKITPSSDHHHVSFTELDKKPRKRNS